MVDLDAPALKLELTPETALGMVQKEVQRRGWKKYEFGEIELVYVPFYIFSFDVIAEGGAPPGKAALNAHTSELNEFVPALLERPIAKVRKIPEDVEAEIEDAAVRSSEVEKVATVKIANALGAKRENILISAVNKIYIPFFRLWVTVAGDEFKIEVDGCLGVPSGLDALPKKDKTWDEAASDTVKKMSSPSGLMQLISGVGGEFAKLVSGKGTENKYLVWGVLLLIIVGVGFFIFQQFQAQVSCEPHDEYLSSPEFLGIFGSRKIVPLPGDGDILQIAGRCTFNARDNRVVIGQVVVKQGGVEVGSENLNASLSANQPRVKEFIVSWPQTEGAAGGFDLSFQKLVG